MIKYKLIGIVAVIGLFVMVYSLYKVLILLLQQPQASSVTSQPDVVEEKTKVFVVAPPPPPPITEKDLRIGLLIHDKNEEYRLPLYGNRAFLGSRGYRYYTYDHTPHENLVELDYNDFLSNGDTVKVPGYPGVFTVQLYTNFATFNPNFRFWNNYYSPLLGEGPGLAPPFIT